MIRKDYAQDIVVNESKKHSGFEFCYKPVYDKITDCVEVEAIPIEWIKRYASEKSYNDGMDCYWHFWEEDIWKMIEDWEKENEID